MQLGISGLSCCAVRLFSGMLLLAPGRGRAASLRRTRLNPDPAVANLCREDLQVHLGGTMSNSPAADVEARAVPGALHLAIGKASLRQRPVAGRAEFLECI